MSSTHLRGIKPAIHPDQEPLTKVPKAPAFLSSYAREEWKRILPTLVSRRILCKADLGAVEELCVMRGIVRQIETERQAAGGVIDPKLFGVANRAAQTARQLAAVLGLDPVSRARIGTAAGDEPDDDDPLSV